jgi:hypothetical protein
MTNIATIHPVFDGTIGSLITLLWYEVPFQRLLALLLGAVIVTTFAFGRYNVPTFTRTSIGDLAQLSPKSLAPDGRYQKGFLIYLFALLGLYFTLCIIGPKILEIPGLPFGPAPKDPTLWPIAVATGLTTIGIAKDTRFPGNIENFIRRKAHEAAYIPTAVTTLSGQLELFDLAGWLKTKASDQETIDAVQAESGGGRIGSISAAARPGEGKRASWIRGNVLFHCLKHLSGDRYGVIKSQDENKDAEKFLTALRDSIRSRLRTNSNWSNDNIDASLGKDIDSFADGASVLLAATLLQATPDARDLSTTLMKLGFKEVDSANPQSWAQFATIATGSVLVVPIIVSTLTFLFSSSMLHYGSIVFGSLSGIKSHHIPDHVLLIQMAASTAIVYSTAFLVLMYVREKRLQQGRWEEKLGGQMDLAKWGGIPAGLIATTLTLFLPGTPLQEVATILLFTLPISVITSVFFVVHMRSAARAGNSRRSMAEHVFGLGTWGHAGIAVIATLGLSVFGMKIDVEKGPDRSIFAAQAQVRAIADRVTNLEGPPPASFDSVNEAIVKEAESRLGRAKETLQALVDSESPEAADIAKETLGAQVAGICGLFSSTSYVDPGILDPHPSNSGTSKQMGPADSCRLIGRIKRDGGALDRDMGELAGVFTKFWERVEKFNDYKFGGTFDKGLLAQCAIAGLLSMFGSLTFGLAVRFGRIQQLRNELDRFDEGTIQRLSDRAKRHFEQSGAEDDLNVWLVTPNQGIGLMTPLEGVRYPNYRSSLFDSLPSEAVDASANEGDGSSTPGNARAASNRASTRPTAIEAPRAVPEASSGAEAQAQIVPMSAVRRSLPAAE